MASSTRTHHIPAGTWRGRVADVLRTDAWMDAHDVSEKMNITRSGASSVLADMMRHEDVVRREVVDAPVTYVYKLRADAIVSD